MVHPAKAMMFWLLGVLPSTMLGFANSNITLVRVLNQTVALTNTSIQMTATFSNLGTNTLNGLCYCDQVP
jgi:hypothetical protein